LPFTQGLPDVQILALLMGGYFNNTDYGKEFRAYAQAQNPGLANCSAGAPIVNQMFRAFLGRNASQAELDYWVPLLSKVGQQQVALGIAITADQNVGQGTIEYFNKVVREGYQRFLRRLPTPDELVKASTALVQSRQLNEQFYAVLMAEDSYCTGEVQPFQTQPIPPANVVQQLVVNVVAPPEVFNVQAPDPIYAADDIQVFSLQRQVNAQNQTIALLGGDTVPCPPDQECIPNPGGGGNTPGQVLIDLTAQVGNLNTQNLLQQTTILGQQQQIAQQQNAISSLVLAGFGVAVDQRAALAARDVAQAKIREAVNAAGNNDPHVQQAQSQYNLGLAALSSADWSAALNRFRIAYQAAAQALH
jgi:hypothetical protein